MVLAVFVGIALFFYFFNSIPLSSAIGRKPTVILDSTGRVEFATLQPEHAREDVPIEELCPPGRRHVCDAVIAAEDASFYQHRGVSIPGIVRAALRNVLQGEIAQGGSTISQQYIKIVTGQDQRTALRKVREAALAMKLEQHYAKDEILELYLNSIYFGRGAYGIQAAAQAYFSIDAKDLTVAQAAQLAAVIPAPSAYDPLENPEGAQQRYRYVLDRMLTQGMISPEEAGRLRASPPEPQRREDISFNDAPFFLDIVRRELEAEFGDEIYTGLRVTTTLNLEVQRHAQAAYDEAFVPIEPTGSLVALDPGTGGILALIGGEHYQTDQFNLAIAPRQAGSTFKPFALAAWIEDEKSPESYFDAPEELVLPRADNGGDWTVHNYEHVEYEPMSLRQATWSSVNTVYAQVQEEVGPRATADLASRAMGLTGDRAFPPLASLVLGTVEITPLQLAEAYNTLASGGIHHSAFAVVEARRDGEVVYRHEPDGERVFSQQVAYGVTDVLEGVISEGSGWRAQIDRPAAGKTGTTQEHGDAWFAGYVPQLTAVVWMGNRDNNDTLPGEPTGGDLPARTWAEFITASLEGVDVVRFPEPDWDGLVVTRPSPSPTPEATELECDEGGVTASEEESRDADEDEDAARQTCVPDESIQPSQAPTELPSHEEHPDPTETPGQTPKPRPRPIPPPSIEADDDQGDEGNRRIGGSMMPKGSDRSGSASDGDGRERSWGERR